MKYTKDKPSVGVDECFGGGEGRQFQMHLRWKELGV